MDPIYKVTLSVWELVPNMLDWWRIIAPKVSLEYPVIVDLLKLSKS